MSEEAHDPGSPLSELPSGEAVGPPPLLDSDPKLNTIRRYGPGEVVVGEQVLHGPCIISPARVIADRIPVTLLTDGMAGWLMQRGEISCVVVGSDRIAANGDVANKIGTYALAVLARHHGLPFYVAAPWSTVDLACPRGSAIPIEERGGDEVVLIHGQRIAPEGVRARYPAFDVTPAELVTAIVTERGVVKAPYPAGLQALAG